MFLILRVSIRRRLVIGDSVVIRKCYSEYDVVVDESIPSRDWDLVKRFTAEFINHVGIGKYSNRANFVSYGLDATKHVICYDFNDKSKKTNAILHVNQKNQNLKNHNIVIGLKTGLGALKAMDVEPGKISIVVLSFC